MRGPVRPFYPATFFSRSRLGLWTTDTRGDRAPGCVYLIRAGVLPTAIWRAPERRRLRGPVWAPDGRSFAVAQKVAGAFYIYRVNRAGRLLTRTLGRDFAFFADGRLVVLRGRHLWLETLGNRYERLASERELARAAGFEAGFYGSMRSTVGYGREAVALQWWARAPAHGFVLLLVSRNGSVRKATPAWRRAGTYMPGAPSWSPAGDSMLIPWQHTVPIGHLHCLGVWSARQGFGNAFCENPHFDTIAWAPGGHLALLEDGRIVTPTGLRRGRVTEKLGSPFSVSWAPHAGP